MLKQNTGGRGLLFGLLERTVGFRAQMGWVVIHRPELFGRPSHIAAQGLLRTASYWPVGERELFGSFTAQVESCPF